MSEAFTEEWESLSTAGQVRFCRDHSAQARAQAVDARPEDKEAYLRIAAEWLKLAQEIEKPATGYDIVRR